MSDERRYALDDIRAAFWAELHMSGERWFPYAPETFKEAEHETYFVWQDFVERLTGARPQDLEYEERVPWAPKGPS